MADDTIRARYEAFFKADFMPLIRYQQTPSAEERLAYATEFAAFHIGRIDSKLGRIIELMERGVAAEPAPSSAVKDEDLPAAQRIS